MLRISKLSLIAGTLCVTQAFAASTKKTTTSPEPTYEVSTTNSTYDSSYNTGTKVKFAIGFKEKVTAIGTALTVLNPLLVLGDHMTIGLDFGFDANFDVFGVGGDFRYYIFNAGAASLFGEADVGFAHTAVAAGSLNNFISGLELGFQYALTPNLKISTSYGLELAFGDGSQGHHIGITQGSFVGNYAMHWYF